MAPKSTIVIRHRVVLCIICITNKINHKVLKKSSNNVFAMFRYSLFYTERKNTESSMSEDFLFPWPIYFLTILSLINIKKTVDQVDLQYIYRRYTYIHIYIHTEDGIPIPGIYRRYTYIYILYMYIYIYIYI